MKKFFLLCGLVLAAASVLAANVRLSWDYDTNSDPITTNLSFSIYSTTNLQTPIGQWLLLTNVLSTQAWDPNTGSFHLDLDLAPAQYFFVMTSSNFWGESITSNVAFTPPPPQTINSLSIQRLP